MTREEAVARKKEIEGILATQKAAARKKEIEGLLGKNTASQDGIILDEQYKPLQGVDRLMIKNFGGTPNEILDTLHKKYPKSEFKVLGGDVNDIVGRDKGSPDWKRMDVPMALTSPSTWELQDITDLGTDLVRGGIEKSAGIAAAGATAASGGLALPVAMAATGATGSGLEYLKQKISEQLGYRNGVNSKEVLGSGAMSGLFGGLFGTGGGKAIAEAQKLKLLPSAAETVTDKLTKQGLARQAMDIQEFGRPISKIDLSGVGKAADKMAQDRARLVEGGALSWLSGKGGDAYKGLASRIGGFGDNVIDNFTRNRKHLNTWDKSSVDQYVEDYANQMKKTVEGNKLQASNAYEEIKNIKTPLNVKDLMAIRDTYARSFKDGSVEGKQAAAVIRKYFKQKMFGETNKVKKTMPVNQVMELEKGFGKPVPDDVIASVQSKFGEGTSGPVIDALNKATEDIKLATYNKLEDALGGKLSKAKSGWAGSAEDVSKLKKFIDPIMGEMDVNKVLSSLKDPQTPSMIKQARLKYLKDIEDSIGMGDAGSKLRDNLEAYYALGKDQAKLFPRSGAPVTVARTIGQAAMGAGAGALLGQSSKGLGAAVGAGAGLVGFSPWATRQMLNAAGAIDPITGALREGFDTFGNAPARALWQRLTPQGEQ